MKDYDKNYFWTTIDPITDKKRYYFRINGTMVEVSKDVYNCCFNSYVKELRYNKKLAKDPMLSLDYTNTDGHKLMDIVHDPKNEERNILDKILIEEIMKEINLMNLEEKKIILENIIGEKSLRKLAKEMKLPLMTLHDKKKKILKKLKDKINR